MNKKRNQTGRIIVLLTIIIIAFIGWNLFGPSVKSSKGKYFYISTGSDFNQVKQDLLSQHILSGTFFFDELSKYSKYEKNVRPGRYKLEDGMSVFSLVRMLRSGRQSPVNLNIVKIRTREELAKKLGDNFEFDSLTAINFLSNKDSLSKYDLDTNTVMTAIIPDNYIFQWNTTFGKVFKKLYSQQQKFWNTSRVQKASQHDLSKTEVYILSSLVEEETNKASDKPKIASVYINRLHQNMKLAADPTVKFAMRDFGLKRIYYKYLSYPSDYNTYLHTGLPPGPICTPSARTIDAVLDAPSTSYLFFVAKPDFSGYSNFATNFSEHDRFAKEYQKALDSLILAKSNKTTEAQ